MPIVNVGSGQTTPITDSGSYNVSFLGAGTLVIQGPAGQPPIAVTLSSVAGLGQLDQVFISNADVTLGTVSGLLLSTYAIDSNGTLRISGTVGASAGLTIEFVAPASRLVLDSALTAGVVSGVAGFAPGSSIDVNAAATSLTYTDAVGSNAGGTLTLQDANGVVATVPLLTGDYTASSFQFQGDGNGGTLVGFGTAVTGVTATAPTAPAGAGIIGLGGAITVDLVLSNSVIVSGGLPMLTRPDLVADGQHGVGLAAANPASADPTDVPVFRFFDEVHGTHFFIASASERDGAIATRSDVVGELQGSFYEQATPQTRDIPAYRFFDSQYGTHFYTDGASERAAILQTRPDLVAEGIGFYEFAHS